MPSPSPSSQAEPRASRPDESDPAARAEESEAESLWVARQVEAVSAAWQRGESVSAEDLLARHPGLGAEAAIRLIYEEVCLRRDAGQDVPTTEVVARFPHWRDEIEVLLECDRLLRPASVQTAFPDVGALLGPFRLTGELGRGASGRTYLATEPDLADRAVVLKLIPDDQEEHLRLARLQHTHIVPLYSEHTFDDRGLRALCMPYLGGASLAQVLAAVEDVPRDERRGHHLVDALARLSPGSAGPPGPCLRYLERATYVEAICWIAACLADALQYAHARGLFHMDVKPSNVLIADDGQPMLLDFHLARGPIAAGEWDVGRIGGTPGWMSPEQEDALRSVRHGQPIARSVDGRSDLYALGRLLHNALLGPDPSTGRADVSVGLGDIIQKCLEPDPADRYTDAAALVDDLRRHLHDLPLQGVANRSRWERLRKWQRRNPGTLARRATWAAALTIALGASFFAAAAYRQRVRALEACLEDGRNACAAGRYADAVRALTRGIEQSQATPGQERLSDALANQLRAARTGQLARELHELADLLRFRYGLDPPARQDAETLARHCRLIWQQRGVLAAEARGARAAGTEPTIRTDLLELAVVWAGLLVRIAPPGQLATARREALHLLEQAEASFGSSPSLRRERRSLGQALGEAARAEEPEPGPRSAWEHYDLGRALLRSARIREAAAEFRRTLEERPQDFWPNFYEGICAYRLGAWDEAAAAFRTCVALAPDAAACHYNRGLAADALGRSEQALADYSRALELDRGLAAAALNRGILHLKAGRHRAALVDLERALGLAGDPAIRGQILYNLALVHLARGARPEALHHGEQALALGCPEAAPLCRQLRLDP